MLSYQFISLDGTRSAFDSSESSLGWISAWEEHIIPQGKQIRTVETLLRRSDGMLWGFKWIGDDGGVLLTVGYIDDDYWRDDTEQHVVTTLTLNHNQTLVGVRSGSGGEKKAVQLSF